MLKVKSKIKNQMLVVKVKSAKDNLINEYEASLLKENKIQFLMKLSTCKSHVIEWTGPKALTLRDFLKQPLAKKSFLFLIAQVVEMLKQVSFYHLKPQNILWDLDRVFVNQFTKELQMLYLPCDGSEKNANIIGFFDSLLYSAIPEQNQSAEFLTRFSLFLKAQDGYHSPAFEAFINSQDKSVLPLLKKYRSKQHAAASRPIGTEVTSENKRNIEGQSDATVRNAVTSNQQASECQKSQVAVIQSDENPSFFDDPCDEETGLLFDHGQEKSFFDEETGLLNETVSVAENQCSEADEETGLLNPNTDDGFEDETGRLLPKDDFFCDETGRLTSNDVEYSEETGLLNPNAGVGSEETGQLNETTSYDAGNPFMDETGIIWEDHDDFFSSEQGTALLNENQNSGNSQGGHIDFSNQLQGSGSERSQQDSRQDDGELLTGRLNPEDADPSYFDTFEQSGNIPKQRPISYPKLYRVRTDEWISINKPVFRLGKEKSYVDYFVNHNNAVSRSHADIITRGNVCYIKDLNSTNKTFIDHYPIPIKIEVVLQDGMHIRLANEEFIYRAADE